MREVENDPVKNLWQISHMLLLASYLCVWQSSQLSNILRSTVRQKERVPSASNTAPRAVTGMKNTPTKAMRWQPMTTAKTEGQLESLLLKRY